MKIMWAAVTRAAQSILNWPSVADREDRAEREGARGGSGARGTLAVGRRGERYTGAPRRVHLELAERGGLGRTAQSATARGAAPERGYPGAGVGARGTLGRREGASRGGGVSGEPDPALGAGAADRVRYGCKVDRSREEFGFGEILASHEDHVGSGNEGRAEHLELAERGGPGGPRRASGTGRAWRTGWSPRCAGDRCAAVEAPDERGRPP